MYKMGGLELADGMGSVEEEEVQSFCMCMLDLRRNVYIYKI